MVCETAAALLGVADEAGLSHLRAVALDFVVMHFDAVAKTGAWAGAAPRMCRCCCCRGADSAMNIMSVCFWLLSVYVMGPILKHLSR